MAWNMYPYTDNHELNLDWFLQQFKNLTEAWDALQAAWTAYQTDLNGQWEAVETAWQTYKTYIDDYFNNLNVQAEINTKIDSMVSSGEFLNLISPTVVLQTTAETSRWLAEHIVQETGYVLDTSLTVAGAAADAKAAGDRITELKNALYGLESNFDYGTLTENSSIFTTKAGYSASSAGWVATEQYNSWYFVAPYELKLYSGTTTNNYLGISIYNGDVSASNYVARYTNIDSNLPTEASQLTVPVGYTVVITIEYRDSNFVIYANNAPLLLGDGFMAQVDGTVRNHINDFTLFNFKGGVLNKNSNIMTAKTGYYASSAGWVASEQFNSYYFTASEEIRIYPATTVLNYYSICIYNGSVSPSNYVARYRQSDNNMPTQDSPLTVASNQVVVVTIEYRDINFVLYSTNAPILLGQQMVEEVNGLIAVGKKNTTVEYTTNKYVITSNGIRFDFRHTVDATINQDCWRFVGVSKGDTELINGDIIGILRENGETDFSGGVHGDEQIVDFVIKADGVDITNATTVCDKVTIFMFSHLYRPSSPTTNTVDRYISMTIENGVLTVDNTFKCLVDNFEVDYAYNGGLIGVFKPNITFLASNTDVADLTDMPTATDWNESHDNFWYDVFLTNGSIHVENIVGHEQANYNARVHYFSSESPQRLKIYITTDENSIWNSGHICNGKFKLEFS